MSVEKIKEYYAKKGYDQHIHMFMALQSAPLLKGVANTSLISLDNRMEMSFQRALGATSFGYSVLHRGVKRSVIFIYDEKKLQAYLNQEQVVKYLKKYGYVSEPLCTGIDCEAVVEVKKVCCQLAKEVEGYYNGEREFPHAIGFFLEYPPADVEAFIQNKGQNYLLSGYWKVYYNADAAKQLFRQYSMAREEAVAEVLSGRKFYEIVA